jgi:hypothetical protein
LRPGGISRTTIVDSGLPRPGRGLAGKDLSLRLDESFCMFSAPPILGLSDLHKPPLTAVRKYRNTIYAPATPLEATDARGWPRKPFRGNTYTNTGGVGGFAVTNKMFELLSPFPATFTRPLVCKPCVCRSYVLGALQVLYLPLLRKTGGWRSATHSPLATSHFRLSPLSPALTRSHARKSFRPSSYTIRGRGVQTH